MTDEEQAQLSKQINAAGAAVPAVYVNNFAAGVMGDNGMFRLSGVERGADGIHRGRGTWIMTPADAEAVHGLLGQLLAKWKELQQ